jgi:hypothetical protein
MFGRRGLEREGGSTNAPINMTAAIKISIKKNLAIEANAGLAVPFQTWPYFGGCNSPFNQPVV